MVSPFQDRLRPSTQSVGAYLSSRELMGAPVQRDYQWTVAHVDALLEDLITHVATRHTADDSESAAPPYFIGTVALLIEEGAAELYDGLQRTTTLILLLALLRDRVSDPALAQRLHSAITVHDEDGSFVSRLRLPAPDRTLSQDICRPGGTLAFRGTGKTGRGLAITRAIRAMERKLDENSAPEPDALAVQVLDHTLLTVIEMDDRDMAELVFRSINKAGLGLEPKDLIKSRLSLIARSEKEAGVLIARWDRVQQSAKRNFREFVRAFAAVCTGEIQPADQAADTLADLMQEAHETGPSGLAHLLKRAVLAASLWDDLVSVKESAAVNTKSVRPLLPMWALRWEEWKPVALAMRLRCHDINLEQGDAASRAKLSAWFDLFQRRCMAYQLSKISAKRRYDIFNRAIQALNAGKDPFQIALTVTSGQVRMIASTLRKSFTDHQDRIDLFKWIEAQGTYATLKHLRYKPRGQNGVPRRGRRRDWDRLVPETPQVEHVLPQRLSPNSPWRQVFNDPDERAQLTDQIGNLALVPEEVNALLAAHPFEAKQRILLKHPWVKKYATARDAADETEWTPDTIRARTERLGALVWDLLKLPGSPAFDEAYLGFWD